MTTPAKTFQPASGGPYFQGQQPYGCGHYFPDVIRLRDELKGDKLYRVSKCIHCGVKRRLMNRNKMLIDAADWQRLKLTGVNVASTEEMFDSVRENELRRFGYTSQS